MSRSILVTLLVLLGAGCACPGARLAKTRFAFDCGDGQVAKVSYAKKAKTMRLEYAGKTYRLPRAVSASGARYSDGRVTFWEKGGTAFIERDGRVVEKKCVLVETKP